VLTAPITDDFFSAAALFRRVLSGSWIAVDRAPQRMLAGAPTLGVLPHSREHDILLSQ